MFNLLSLIYWWKSYPAIDIPIRRCHNSKWIQGPGTSFTCEASLVVNVIFYCQFFCFKYCAFTPIIKFSINYIIIQSSKIIMRPIKMLENFILHTWDILFLRQVQLQLCHCISLDFLVVCSFWDKRYKISPSYRYKMIVNPIFCYRWRISYIFCGILPRLWR